MLIEGLWVFALLEALLLATVSALYLGWKYRRLARAVAAAPSDGQPALSADDYLALLQTQILGADAELAKLTNQPDGDKHLVDVVSARLTFLRAERKAIDSCGQDRGAFWAEISAALGPYLPDIKEDSEDDDRERLITALQMRLQAYETRVANLEQFRVNFFEIKRQYADAIGLGKQLHAEVGKALPQAEQPPELRDAMDKLEAENVRLEGQLAHVEQEFDSIMRNLQAATDRSQRPASQSGIATSIDSIGQGVVRIKKVILAQENRIHELTGVISGLQLELGDKQRLEQAVNEFKDRQTELTNAIVIIQNENESLQEQLASLMRTDAEDQGKVRERIKALRQELEEQREAYIALEKNYATMEREYLAAYEENRRLKA